MQHWPSAPGKSWISPTVKGQNSFNQGTESTGPEGCGDYAATDPGQTCRLIMPWTDDLPHRTVCLPTAHLLFHCASTNTDNTGTRQSDISDKTLKKSALL